MKCLTYQWVRNRIGVRLTQSCALSQDSITQGLIRSISHACMIYMTYNSDIKYS
jgi:hypothetical protein